MRTTIAASPPGPGELEWISQLASRFGVAIPKRVTRGPRDAQREKLLAAVAAAQIAGTVSPRRNAATDLGPADARRTLRIAVGLALRNRAALETFLAIVDEHGEDSSSPRLTSTLGRNLAFGQIQCRGVVGHE